MVDVLWVIKGLGPGGAETLLAAAAAGHHRGRVHLECAYVLPYKDHLAARLERAGVVTRCVSRTQRDLLWPLRLARLIRNGGFDVVHVHSPLPGSVARLAARSMGRRGPKIVTTEHNSWDTFARSTRLLNRVTSRWNDAVFAVSDEVRASMRGGAGGASPVTLAHGIDVAGAAAMGAERRAVRAELGIADDEVVIGTVANFRVQKDYPNLLAAARVLAERGVAARWLVVGQGPLEAEMRNRAVSLGLGDRVIFTGFRADAVRVMAGFDVFTLASAWEGLPVALMEALALGLPVVATDVGGVGEAMRDGVDAVLVPARDAVALADAWQRVVTDESSRVALGQAARARAGEFDVSRAVAVIEAEYERLVPSAADGPVDVAQVDVAQADGDRVDGAPVESSSTRRRASGLTVRAATPDDEPAILELLRRSLGWSDDPRFVDLYRWKHQLSPFGPSPTWVALDGDRVVAVRIFMRWEFVRDGVVLRAVRAVDTATDPDHQGRGLFTELTLHGLDQMMAEGVDFVFNTPNDQSRPGYLKMGWCEVGRLSAAVRPIGVGGLVRTARSRVAAALWSNELPVGQAFGEWADGQSLHAWQPAAASSRSLVTNGSDAFYRWRFGLPDLRYRVVERDGVTLVVRARARGSANELVVAAGVGATLSERDAVAAWVGRRAGADHVLRLGAPDVRHGFVPLPGGGPVMTFRPLREAAMPPLANWQLEMADVELF